MVTVAVGLAVFCWLQLFTLAQLRRLHRPCARCAARSASPPRGKTRGPSLVELLERTSRVEWPRHLQASVELSGVQVAPPTKRKAWPAAHRP